MGMGVPTRVYSDERPAAPFFRVAEAVGQRAALVSGGRARRTIVPARGNAAGAQRQNHNANRRDLT